MPLLSVFAAFSFVIMMFNLPLPGGTTGHAVGMGVATIVLGPAASILAISLALLIQALFFGDGGITAFGANCFNMAVVGSLTAFVINRVLSWRSDAKSARRVLAAGLAGYGAINLSALIAAIEFGIQPILFRDRSGAPLYAPYPLSISIPAMMIGHLTVAGFAEFILSAGLVAYLQRSDPALLQAGSGEHAHFPKGLWALLGILLLLTPVGILAVGTAWGEWRPQEVGSPKGMMHLYSLWSAPFSGYAPGFIANASGGYFFSAAVGICLVLFIPYVLGKLFARRSFIESSIQHLVSIFDRAFFAEEVALSKGLLQSFDARVKIAAFICLLLVTLATQRLLVLTAVLIVCAVLGSLSQIPFRGLVVRTWWTVLAFTGLIALPAVFLTPGDYSYRVPWLGLSVTFQGLRASAFLILRAEATATLALLLIQSTLWNTLLRALRFFRVPSVAVVLLAMTYRYVFVLLHTAQSMLESRQTKLTGKISGSDQRRLAASSIGVLLDKSMELSSEVHTAMRARGFHGEVHVLEDVAMRSLDWLQMIAIVVVSIALVLLAH